jgi:hypothetical protein
MSSEAEVRVSVPSAPGAGIEDPPQAGRQPEGHSIADFAPPDLAQSPQLTIEQWESRAGDQGDVLVWGCVRGAAREWSRDATDVAQGKLAELASSTVARMRAEPTPMHVTASAHDGRERSLAADGRATAQARTFVAFTPGKAHGCFVACVPHDEPEHRRSCNDSGLADVALTGDLGEPPPPGMVLQSLAFVVHHPHKALGMLGATLVFGAALAIATRRRG